MLKAISFASIKYKRPTKEGIAQFRNLLKYLENRDGSLRRDEYLRLRSQGVDPKNIKIQARDTNVKWRAKRWIDRGMGGKYDQIITNAKAVMGERVFARALVLSPDPELMEHIPEDKRLSLLLRYTERTMHEWSEANGWGEVPYSYVVHDKISSTQKQMLHTHIVMPGTIELDEVEDLGRVELTLKKGHLADFRSTSHRVFQEEMERELGRDRVQKILVQRDRRIAEQRRAAWEQRTEEERAAHPAQHRRQTITKLYELRSVMHLLEQQKKQKQEKKQRRKRISHEHLYIYMKYQREQHTKQQAAQHREQAIQASIQRGRDWRRQDELAIQQSREEERQRLKREHQRAYIHARMQGTYSDAYIARQKDIAWGVMRDMVEAREGKPLPDRQPALSRGRHDPDLADLL